MLAATLSGLAATASAQEVPTPWRFAGIGTSQTLIHVVANGGRCEEPGVPQVQETATTVRITTTVRPGLQYPCPAVIDFDDVFVRLAEPLRGRKLLGAAASSISLTERPPRVVGLAPGDAISVLTAARGTPTGAPIEPVVVRRAGGDGLRRVVSQKGARIVIAGTAAP